MVPQRRHKHNSHQQAVCLRPQPQLQPRFHHQVTTRVINHNKRNQHTTSEYLAEWRVRVNNNVCLRYLKEFRVDQCPSFLQHKCTQHKPFTCFNWHFNNQRRRRPVKKVRDGMFNYSADVYCTKYDETTGLCPDGDEWVSVPSILYAFSPVTPSFDVRKDYPRTIFGSKRSLAMSLPFSLMQCANGPWEWNNNKVVCSHETSSCLLPSPSLSRSWYFLSLALGTSSLSHLMILPLSRSWYFPSDGLRSFPLFPFVYTWFLQPLHFFLIFWFHKLVTSREWMNEWLAWIQWMLSLNTL